MSGWTQIWVMCFLVFDISHAVVAQVDSLVETDSLGEYSLESVVEQSSQTEDSPLLDYIMGRNEQQQPSIELRSRLTQALQQSKGITSGVYLGSPPKSYQRVKFSAGEHLGGGILFEKDAGERRFDDFTSANLMIANLGPLTKGIFGDFFVESGQGIGLWRGFDVSKGSEVILPVRRDAAGLNQYLSSDENSFLRGVAMEFQWGRFSPLFFYSSAARSASLDALDRVTSLYTSGYFRTTTEQEKKNNLTEKLVGASLHYQMSDANRFGVSWYRTTFSRQLFFDDGRMMDGGGYSFASIDYNVSFLTTSIFGEWGKSNNVMGGISGLLIRPTPALDLILAARHYPPRFVSLHGLAFGEQTSNEDGVYLGFQLKPMRHVRISSFYDQFQFSASGSNAFPRTGHDVLLQLQTQPVSRLEFTMRYRRKITYAQSSQLDTNGFTHEVGDDQRKQQIRIDANYHLSKNIRLRCRLERLFLDTRISGAHENGVVTYQDLRIQPSDRVWFAIRVAYFKSDSFESGITDYENDLPGVVTLPVLYGTGVRWYFLIRYKLAGLLELSAKYSDLMRDDVKRIGTALDELPSNHDNRLSVQLDLRW